MAYLPQDRYFKRAKQEGYRSRAAFKLIELQQRFRVMSAGDSVVDLGAAPGGWLQVAAQSVGQKGKVIGVDLQAIQPFQERNITLLQGDITKPEIRQRTKELTNGPVNCVLSDMAPNLSGIRATDVARCMDLNRAALLVAVELLRPGGVLLVKSFISDDLQTFTAELKNFFSAVQRTKPQATRPGSSEFYFYAKGFSPKTSGGGRIVE